MSKDESSGEAGSQDAAAPDIPPKDSNADIYDNRGPKKIIRIVTVMAYLFSVSFVGILLSAYYLFLWEPPTAKFTGRGHLRANAQVQFLMAEPSLEEINMKKKVDLFNSELNHTYKALPHSAAHDSLDGDPVDLDPAALEKQARLNIMLLKLRQSLVESLRARNRNLSHAAIYSESDNSFTKVEKELDLTRKADQVESSFMRLGKSRRKEKIQTWDETDPIPEFADPAKAVDINASSALKSATILVTKLNQNHLNAESVPDTDRNYTKPINNLGRENQHYKKKLVQDVTRLYTIYGSNGTEGWHNLINGSNRAFEDRNSSRIVQKMRVDISDNETELIRENSTANLHVINSDLKTLNSPNDPHTIATSTDGSVEGRKSRLPSINVHINSTRLNSTSNNECSSNSRTEQIPRDEVSISLSRDTGFTNNPGFYQSLNDSTVKRLHAMTNSEGERFHADLQALLAVLG